MIARTHCWRNPGAIMQNAALGTCLRVRFRAQFSNHADSATISADSGELLQSVGCGRNEATPPIRPPLSVLRPAVVSASTPGLYVALPTMATANAMFNRLGDACRYLFATDTESSIALRE